MIFGVILIIAGFALLGAFWLAKYYDIKLQEEIDLLEKELNPPKEGQLAYYYNQYPGAELKSQEDIYAPVKHTHLCPKCETLWEHAKFMCKDLNKVTEVNGNAIPAVPLICDTCL